MSKLFSSDNETLICAENVNQAVELYKEEFDEDLHPSEFQELSADDTIVHTVEIVGLGGYSEIYASDVINTYSKDGINTPYILNSEEYIRYVTE